MTGQETSPCNGVSLRSQMYFVRRHENVWVRAVVLFLLEFVDSVASRDEIVLHLANFHKLCGDVARVEILYRV